MSSQLFLLVYFFIATASENMKKSKLYSFPKEFNDKMNVMKILKKLMIILHRLHTESPAYIQYSVDTLYICIYIIYIYS